MSWISKDKIVEILKLTCAVIFCVSALYIHFTSSSCINEGDGPTFWLLFLIVGVAAIDWTIRKTKECYRRFKSRFSDDRS